MSSFTRPLSTVYIGGGFRRVSREFKYYIGREDKGESILVPEGFKTDFASIPWPASMLIPRSGDYNQPAVLHDYLYSQLGVLPNKTYTRRQCDKIFLGAMVVINLMSDFNISSWRRGVMYRAVRMGGGFGWKKHMKRRIKNAKK